VSDREERIGRNEEIFRRVNEQIEQVNKAFGEVSGSMTLVCECGNGTCIEQLEVTPDEYTRLRSDRTLFAIRPGHEIPDVEDVVDQADRYWVVKKHEGTPAEVARELAPDDL
jgi:hypothetical protein